MGQIKNIKLHIVTDIKVKHQFFLEKVVFAEMATITEKPVTDVIKEPDTKAESKPDDETKVKSNGTKTTEEKSEESNGHTEKVPVEGNGHTEKDDSSVPEDEKNNLKRKEAPTEVADDSTKKKKSTDSPNEEKSDAGVVEV